MFERSVLEEIEVAGVRLPRGSEVALQFASANRDPAAFADPDTLDLGRDSNPHVSFGAGIHFCLGAPLARMELQIAFRTMLRRAPGIELVEEPRWKPTYVLRGLEALRVRPTSVPRTPRTGPSGRVVMASLASVRGAGRR